MRGYLITQRNYDTLEDPTCLKDTEDEKMDNDVEDVTEYCKEQMNDCEDINQIISALQDSLNYARQKKEESE